MNLITFVLATTVSQAVSTFCEAGIPLTALSGRITNQHAARMRCRWPVRVDVGRRINVTLFDFGVDRHLDASSAAGTRPPFECQKYAVIREVGTQDTVVCSGVHRSKVVYISETNSIEIVTYGGSVGGGLGGQMAGGTGASPDDGARYLLVYEGIFIRIRRIVM